MIVILCLIGLVAQSLGQVITQENCPSPSGLSNFNENSALGVWYEGWRVNNTYEPDHHCGKITYYRHNNGNLVERVNSIIMGPGTWTFWESELIPKKNSGKYHMTFPSYSTDPGIDVVFTATDNYQNWLILYGCTQDDEKAIQNLWVWVKNPADRDQYKNDVAAAVSNTGLSFDDLIEVDHTDCPNRNTDACFIYE